MRLIRRPWVWFYRVRKRRGYGVHSPFAFSFLTYVVYERTAYYAYHDLNRLHPWWVRWGRLYPLTCRRLLFRLANYVHPQRICIMGDRPMERAYLTAAVPRAEWVEGDADFLFVAHEQLAEALTRVAQMPERGMMVVEGIHEDRTSNDLWRCLQNDAHTGITFDLYTYGLLFFSPALQKQHYIVNF